MLAKPAQQTAAATLCAAIANGVRPNTRKAAAWTSMITGGRKSAWALPTRSSWINRRGTPPWRKLSADSENQISSPVITAG